MKTGNGDLYCDEINWDSSDDLSLKIMGSKYWQSRKGLLAWRMKEVPRSYA